MYQCFQVSIDFFVTAIINSFIEIQNQHLRQIMRVITQL